MDENHSLEMGSSCVLPRKEEDFTSPLRNSEADEEEMVEMGEGFNFLARLFRMYCPFGFPISSFSFFSSFFSSAYSLMQYTTVLPTLPTLPLTSSTLASNSSGSGLSLGSAARQLLTNCSISSE
jgi:hypothetical protein